MSERGSFVTEYIYCSRCFEAASGVLLDRSKALSSIAVPSWENGATALPIIAGKLGGSRPGEELDDMECDYLSAVAEKLCEGHRIRVAVLAEVGYAMFEVAYRDDVQTLARDPAITDSIEVTHTCDATCVHTYYQCENCGQNVRASKHTPEMCDLMRESAELRAAIDVTVLARARSVLINMRSPLTAPTQETVDYTIVELGGAITTIQGALLKR